MFALADSLFSPSEGLESELLSIIVAAEHNSETERYFNAAQVYSQIPRVQEELELALLIVIVAFSLC